MSFVLRFGAGRSAVGATVLILALAACSPANDSANIPKANEAQLENSQDSNQTGVGGSQNQPGGGAPNPPPNNPPPGDKPGDSNPIYYIPGVKFETTTDNSGYYKSIQVVWSGIKQVGTHCGESASGLGLDADGNTYSFIASSCDLTANEAAGYFHPYILKRDPTGTEVWRKKIHYFSYDNLPGGMRVDGAGNIFLIVRDSYNAYSFYLAKYSPDGVELFAKKFNAAALGSQCIKNCSFTVPGLSLSAGGDINLVGCVKGEKFANDAFYARFNSAGELEKYTELGLDVPNCLHGVTPQMDNKMVCAAGSITGKGAETNIGTSKTLGGTDALVACLNDKGEVVDTFQFGSSGDDWANAISPLAGWGSFVVVGNTSGTMMETGDPFSKGGVQAFAVMMFSDGSIPWSKQFGPKDKQTTGEDVVYTPQGTIALVGRTNGIITSGTKWGNDSDPYLLLLDLDGNWIQDWRLGSLAADKSAGGNDTAEFLAIDKSGNFYLLGDAHGSMGGAQYFGEFDVFIAKFSPKLLLQ